MSLFVSGLTFSYADEPVLRDIELDVPTGVLLAIVGPSGGGKSTLLKAIAGLVHVRDGDIQIAEKSVGAMRPHRRDISMLFQGESLYPHLTIGNGIRCTLSGSRSEERLALASKRFGVEQLLDRYPHQLSGGQRRRCGLAKIAAQSKTIRLLDEPLSGLDHPIADQIASDLASWHQTHPGVTVLVTHDVRHAHRYADQMAVIDEGQILQCGRPGDLLRSPCHRNVATYASPEPMQWFNATDAVEIPLSTKVIQGQSLLIGFQALHCRPLIETAGVDPGGLRIRPDSVRPLGSNGVELTIGQSTIHAIAHQGSMGTDRDATWSVAAEHWNAFDSVTGLLFGGC